MNLQNGQAVILWCNGQWTEAGYAPVAWGDRGWTHGLGVFETMLAVEGKIVFADMHEARLSGALAVLGWDVGISGAFGSVCGLLEKNGLSSGRARVRLAVSGGEGGLRLPSEGKQRMVWMSAARAENPPESVVVGVSRWKRNECSPLAGLKSASYAENLLILQDATRQGWDEALLFNHAGHLCEAATSNVFLAADGKLRTPPISSGCLPGVTREVVIGLAREMGISCEEVDLTEDDLIVADEVFLTSSTRGVVPVVGVNDRSLAIGPLAAGLRVAWLGKTGCGPDVRGAV